MSKCKRKVTFLKILGFKRKKIPSRRFCDQIERIWIGKMKNLINVAFLSKLFPWNLISNTLPGIFSLQFLNLSKPFCFFSVVFNPQTRSSETMKRSIS